MNTSSNDSFPGQAPASVQPLAYAEASARPAAGTGDGALPAAELERREKTARDSGRREGEAAARAACETELNGLRAQIAETLMLFQQERTGYYQQVEGEVLQLALNIARKILHRESQVDPMLLAGVVRVTLEQMEANTEVLVRVEPERAASWREYFAAHIDPADLPQVVEDPALEPGRCVLQTRLGKTELGIEVQLKEIERGLLDLLGQRPH